MQATPSKTSKNAAAPQETQPQEKEYGFYDPVSNIFYYFPKQKAEEFFTFMEQMKIQCSSSSGTPKC